MALASWRPPGHLPQPPDVSRPCQKQLSPRSHLLQVVSEALDIPIHQQQQQQELLGGVPLQTPEVVIAEKSAAAKKFDFSRQSSPSPPTSSKTNVVTASDGQISNGFVLHGHNLPYVFEEATDPSGARKKSSKILPVCAVCGKKFVCVTTMKRHLVTHTGEKPFSCKICGKQYTQKGNLRVHERTHRNDRPFQCQICHQKFYRKEPMQKHQWRQHGIVHLKSGRTTSSLQPPVEQPKSSSIQQDSDHPNDVKKSTLSSSNNNDNINDNNNIETSPIKLKMKLAYQQQQQILLMDQCKIEQKSPRNPILNDNSNSNNNNDPSSFSDFKKSSTTNHWIQEIVTDKPLDLSCSKSNYNNYNSIISQKLSDNQPSQLPTEKTNITTTNTLPFSKTYTTITNVPTTTIQMSDATGTLSKLLQNFSTKKSTTTITPATNNPPTKPNQNCSKLLLHGLFQSESSTRNI